MQRGAATCQRRPGADKPPRRDPNHKTCNKRTACGRSVGEFQPVQQKVRSARLPRRTHQLLSSTAWLCPYATPPGTMTCFSASGADHSCARCRAPRLDTTRGEGTSGERSVRRQCYVRAATVDSFLLGRNRRSTHQDIRTACTVDVAYDGTDTSHSSRSSLDSCCLLRARLETSN